MNFNFENIYLTHFYLPFRDDTLLDRSQFVTRRKKYQTEFGNAWMHWASGTFFILPHQKIPMAKFFNVWKILVHHVQKRFKFSKNGELKSRIAKFQYRVKSALNSLQKTKQKGSTFFGVPYDYGILTIKYDLACKTFQNWQPATHYKFWKADDCFIFFGAPRISNSFKGILLQMGNMQFFCTLYLLAQWIGNTFD